jgi:hypothetical protein
VVNDQYKLLLLVDRELKAGWIAPLLLFVGKPMANADTCQRKQMEVAINDWSALVHGWKLS